MLKGSSSTFQQPPPRRTGGGDEAITPSRPEGLASKYKTITTQVDFTHAGALTLVITQIHYIFYT